jgi:hypothetical protein
MILRIGNGHRELKRLASGDLLLGFDNYTSWQRV